MKLFQLTQKTSFVDFSVPDPEYVNIMLVSAEDKDQARILAFGNELEYRDGKQSWNIDHASCTEIVLPERRARVYLVS